MSSDPSPQEVVESLKSLRSEIIESRNLTIKTDNLIKNLSSDVRQIGKRQEKYEKRYVFNSVVAYVLFSVLIFAGLYLAFQAQVAREREAVDAAKVRITDLQGRVQELESELERRRDAEEQSYSLVRLLEEGKQDQLLTAFPQMRGKLVNRGEIELLRREVDQINEVLAKAAFEEGVKHFTGRRYEAARDSFMKSLGHLQSAHYSPDLHSSLGMSLFLLKDYTNAATHLRQALNYTLTKEVRNDTMYALAVALDELGRGGEARTVYEAYVKRFAFDKRAPLSQKRVLHFIREGVTAEGTVPADP